MSLRHLVSCVCVMSVLAVGSFAQAGARGGPKAGADTIVGLDTHVYYVEFYGGEYAEVAIVGEGRTDLDLFIFDENGNLIVSDESYSDVALCGWTPRWTGMFRIEVRNLGRSTNHYGLGTN